jgi:parvulin-like peptidyl-prolyl isomerase
VDTAADEAALKAEAEKIRTRAAAGEDFEKFEDEAYTFAGDPDDTPDTDMGDNTRAELGHLGKTDEGGDGFPQQLREPTI